jgi:hypothetical protein
MANLTTRRNQSPALRQAFAYIPPLAYVDVRDPINGRDVATYGQQWINSASGTTFWYINEVTKTWSQGLTSTGTAGDFATLNVTTTITAGTDITSTAGDIVADAGNIEAIAGSIVGQSIYSAGDLGGVVTTNAFTNVVNTTQGAGALSIVSTTANSGTNTGFIKGYVGTTTVYIPYFSNIAP